MSNIKLYYHGGSANHGCEAIVRATKKILDTDISLITTAPDEDQLYGLNEIADILPDTNTNFKKRSLRYILSALQIKISNKTTLNTKYRRKQLLKYIQSGDICLSIGGDNYCYPGVEVLGDLNYLIKQKKAKTVLWGCSIDSSNFNDSIIQDLKRYDLITVRETLTQEGLAKYGITDNVLLYPDPAFQLDTICLPLPEHFIPGNTVGINISPLIIDCEKNNGITEQNYIELIQYIIDNTDMNIALIPHVVKQDTDDRKPLKKLYDLFKDTNRICLIEDHNCMELKGYISRYRFFIGARTHATIAAYSTCVPTLVVGYSIKAKGIAKDLFGTYDQYVLPVQSLQNKDDLTTHFKWIMTHETEIKEHLQQFIPDYKKKALQAGEKVRDMMK